MQPSPALVLLLIVLVAIPSGIAGYVIGSASWVLRTVECEGAIERMSIQLDGRTRL
jgi:hypothetical protein